MLYYTHHDAAAELLLSGTYHLVLASGIYILLGSAFLRILGK